MHRDLKPANIMVDAEGQRADHGLRHRALDVGRTGPSMTAAAPSSAPSNTWRRSRPGASPVDQRADIYAFGLILHDMLLGRRQGGSSTASPS